jgi:hypothetical protein
MKRALVHAVILLALLAARAQGDPGPAPWLAGLRAASGLAALEEDELLCRTAQSWARVLAAAGRIGHRGADGSTALDRYRAQGGTEARVGEIIGAGPSLLEVERAWEKSASHRDAVLKPYWTHAGWGSAPAGESRVWVVLFTRKVVCDLRVTEASRGVEVRGIMAPAAGGRPALYAGLDPVAPESWDRETGEFTFLLGPGEARSYLRLGWLDAGGLLAVTNVLTLPRETVSPAGPGRSGAPAGPP